MNEKPKLGRPPKPDARVQVSLRLHPDVLAAYVAGGPEWRGRMEAAIIAGLAPKTPKPPSGGSSVKPPPTPRVEVVHVAVPTYERKPFNPQPKTGKKKK